jgi:hypothetical protein
MINDLLVAVVVQRFLHARIHRSQERASLSGLSPRCALPSSPG